MPTFSPIALDIMLEPGASTSLDTVPRTTSLYPKPPLSKLEDSKGKLSNERTVTRPQMSPALYATPEAIPLPHSPSSFPPSPYIINHKSRGPRIVKSSSEANVVSSQQKTLKEETITSDTDVKASPRRKSTSFSFPISEATEEGFSNGSVRNWSPFDGKIGNEKLELDNAANGSEHENDLLEPVSAKEDKESETEDFYDPGETASFTSNTEVEGDAGDECSQRLAATSAGEFYDAWDELSTDSGMQSSVKNIEAELREIRLSLLMEIEKRKQTEEALEQMQIHWQRLREQLGQEGLFLPIDPTASTDINISEGLRCQLEIARFVSDSLGRGMAKAEKEMEMESMLEAKNFEITRLCDRVHYYEAVNREMSQRNQEAIEVARRERQKRKKKQRWIWGSIAATITIGSAALAWSYVPASKPSSLKDD